MTEGMDDPLNSGRIAPLGDDYDGADPGGYESECEGGYEGRYGARAKPQGCDASSAPGQQPLTHRPRNLARLTASAIKGASLLSGAARGTAPRFQEDSGSPLDAPKGQAPDLGPFADQLVAIAEKLRRGDFAPPGVMQHVPALGSNSAQHLAPEPNNSNREANGNGYTKTTRHDQTERPLSGLDPEERRQTFAEMARVAYAKRRKRVTIFGDPELFGEPAWDILLDLYVAQVEGKSVSVSSACIGSASPPTTGLRWLGVLSQQGMLEREHDPQDQRRVLVQLTEKALDAMDDYFANSAGLTIDRRSA